MTLSKSVMASYTTLVSDPDSLNFDYDRESLPLPLNHSVITFHRALFNSYYSLLPHLRSQIQESLYSEAIGKVSSFALSPLYIICLLLFLLSVFSSLMTIYVKKKINDAVRIS